MTRDELVDQLASCLDSGDSPWPFLPLCAGNWLTLTRAESLRVLARLAAEQAARGEDPIPFHHCVRRLRGMPLPFYEECLLLEGWVDLTGRPSAQGASFGFVLSSTGCVVLNWRAEEITALNRRLSLRFAGNEDRASYLRFFSGVAGTADGRFRIVESESDVGFTSEADETQRASVAARLHPIQIEQVDDSRCTASASLIHDQQLFAVEFSLLADGSVAMVDDVPLDERLAVQVERLIGPFRIFQ
ncbi:MAG: hypothetical protein R3E82_11395 [Pseudomonadales bacterium]|nr:hypothetical protein [Pseudomonadales bacterium]